MRSTPILISTCYMARTAKCNKRWLSLTCALWPGLLTLLHKNRELVSSAIQILHCFNSKLESSEKVGLKCECEPPHFHVRCTRSSEVKVRPRQAHGRSPASRKGPMEPVSGMPERRLRQLGNTRACAANGLSIPTAFERVALWSRAGPSLFFREIYSVGIPERAPL